MASESLPSAAPHRESLGMGGRLCDFGGSPGQGYCEDGTGKVKCHPCFCKVTAYTVEVGSNHEEL